MAIDVFHELRLPDKYSRGAEGGGGWSTKVSRTKAGREQRQADFAEDLARWKIGHLIKGPDDALALQAFHHNRRGRATGFRFKWWMDYQARATFQAIGDGATNAFQLVKTYADILAGQAQAGGPTTITLAAEQGEYPFHGDNDVYNGKILRVVGGTGAGQVRQITDYDGASKLATIAPAWSTDPDATSLYELELYQYQRKIFKPAPDGITPVFYINDAPAAATLDLTDGSYSIDGGAPGNGVIMTADFDFDFPVRFDTDFQNWTWRTTRWHDWRDIGLVELLDLS